MTSKRCIIIHIIFVCVLCVLGTPSKTRRQVVAPTWLTRPDQLPSPQATKVIVTPKSLEEAANIRATIQKAVNEGSYVIATNPQEFLIALGQTGNTNAPGATAALPVLPAFTVPTANWWRPLTFG